MESPSSLIIKQSDTISSLSKDLCWDLTSFMCVNPHSQAALVAGMVRIRSKKFNTCGYSFLNLLLTCNHVVSDDIKKASSTAVLSIGHSAFIWSSLSSRYDPNWSSNVFIQSSPNVCSSSSLIGHILKSAIAVAFTTLVSSKRCSKAVHNASTRTFYLCCQEATTTC